MSDIICSAINSFIEPPFQNAAFICTSPLLNVITPRIISQGGYYSLHATQSAALTPTSAATATTGTTSDNKENINKTTRGVCTAQKSRLAYKPLNEGFSNFLFQWAHTSEFATSLHFKLVRGADPEVMEKNITDVVNRAQYARKVYFQQGSLAGVDLSKCFANAKMIEEIYFMNTPSPENIAELSQVAPNLKVLYCSCADLITDDAIIKFCEGRKRLFENSKSSHPTSLHKLLLWKCLKITKAEAIQAIASLPALEILSLRRCTAFSGSDLERINACFGALSTIPRLRDLDLEATLTDIGLRHIGEGLPLLKKLYFYACSNVKDCTVDRGFYHLFKGLHQIDEFSISEMPPAALDELSRCKTLRVLKLYDCDIKDKDLACLNALENLEWLQLAHCDEFKLPPPSGSTSVSDEDQEEQEEENNDDDDDDSKKKTTKKMMSGFSQVSNGNLKRLILNYCRGIESSIYSEIANSFPKLRVLHVFTAEAPVRDEDLQALSKLSYLEDLLLNDMTRSGTATKEGLRYLRRSNLKNLRTLDLSGVREGMGCGTEEKMWKVIEQN